jgi:predicted unusual protein kinase regulating ubiquinone biosynthesis (AarF/ABC1/UbiB family)
MPELSSQQVLTTEWVNGVTIDKVNWQQQQQQRG